MVPFVEVESQCVIYLILLLLYYIYILIYFFHRKLKSWNKRVRLWFMDTFTSTFFQQLHTMKQCLSNLVDSDKQKSDMS